MVWVLLALVLVLTAAVGFLWWLYVNAMLNIDERMAQFEDAQSELMRHINRINRYVGTPNAS